MFKNSNICICSLWPWHCWASFQRRAACNSGVGHRRWTVYRLSVLQAPPAERYDYNQKFANCNAGDLLTVFRIWRQAGGGNASCLWTQDEIVVKNLTLNIWCGGKLVSGYQLDRDKCSNFIPFFVSINIVFWGNHTYVVYLFGSSFNFSNGCPLITKFSMKK